MQEKQDARNFRLSKMKNEANQQAKKIKQKMKKRFMQQ